MIQNLLSFVYIRLSISTAPNNLLSQCFRRIMPFWHIIFCSHSVSVMLTYNQIGTWWHGRTHNSPHIVCICILCFNLRRVTWISPRVHFGDPYVWVHLHTYQEHRLKKYVTTTDTALNSLVKFKCWGRCKIYNFTHFVTLKRKANIAEYSNKVKRSSFPIYIMIIFADCCDALISWQILKRQRNKGLPICVFCYCYRLSWPFY